jgi:acetate---CoA ligase (ADP-forming)
MLEFLKSAVNEKRNPMEYEVYEFLETQGIKFPSYWVMKSESDLDQIKLELPIDKKFVCKAMSPKILHKTDLQAVKLNVAANEIRDLYKEYQKRFEHYDFRAMLIVPMVSNGIELLIGSTIDPSFGPVSVFGIGGTLVEVVRDVTFGKCPLSNEDAELMIDSIKLQDLFHGPRGLPKLNRKELVDFLAVLSKITCRYENIIAEIDLNPVRITSQGLIPLDARIILKKDIKLE